MKVSGKTTLDLKGNDVRNSWRTSQGQMALTGKLRKTSYTLGRGYESCDTARTLGRERKEAGDAFNEKSSAVGRTNQLSGERGERAHSV